MPIKVIIKEYDFFDVVYLKNDDEQLAWEISEVITTPLGNIFCLFRNGEIIEAYEGQFSKERDKVKALGGRNNDD
jgi:hypothetical protein